MVELSIRQPLHPPRLPANHDPSWVWHPKSFMLKQTDVPGLLMLEQGPQSRSFRELKHVGELQIVYLKATVRGVRHFSEHGFAPVWVCHQSVTIVELSYPLRWK